MRSACRTIESLANLGLARHWQGLLDAVRLSEHQLEHANHSGSGVQRGCETGEWVGGTTARLPTTAGAPVGSLYVGLTIAHPRSPPSIAPPDRVALAGRCLHVDLEGITDAHVGPGLKAAHRGCRKPHAARHTFAWRLLENGESPACVKEQMGHSSIRITVDIYGHLAPGGNRAAVAKLDALDTVEAPAG